MANVDNPNGFYPYTNMGGGTGFFPTIDGDLTATESIARGDGVIASSGFLTILLAASTSVFGVAAGAITTANTGGETFPVYPAIPQMVYHAQNDTAVAYVEATHRYVTCDMIGATGAGELDLGASATDVAMPINIVDDSINTIGAHTRLQFVWVLSDFVG